MGAAEVPQERRPGGSRGVARGVAGGGGAVARIRRLASAQQAISTGTITGIVQDEQGLPVPGARSRSPTARRASGADDVQRHRHLQRGRRWHRALHRPRQPERVRAPSRELTSTCSRTRPTTPGTLTLRAGMTETLTVKADPIARADDDRRSHLRARHVDDRHPRVARPRSCAPPQLAARGRSQHQRLDYRRHHRHEPADDAGHRRDASYVAIDGVGSADGDTGNNNGITSMDAIQEFGSS